LAATGAAATFFATFPGFLDVLSDMVLTLCAGAQTRPRDTVLAGLLWSDSSSIPLAGGTEGWRNFL
jgi:hypothetical protein